MYLQSKVVYRVVEKHANTYKVKTNHGVKVARLKGSYSYSISSKEASPCVGDWVEAIDDGNIILIERIQSRKSLVSRRASGGATVQQAIAANVDYVIIVLGVDGGRNYSDRLLERLLTVAWNSGATPLVALNKSDLNEAAELIKRQAETIALGVDIINCSAVDGTGIEELLSYVSNGKIGVFIGPSGVGKSTLTNTLLKHEVQATNSLRVKDMRGRHTTSGSYLFELKNGGFIVDSSGIKEVQIWANNEDVDSVFEEISSISHECKYRDCQHQGEPGCAVQEELEVGNITPERYDSYLHLKQEVAYLDRKKNEKGNHVERQHDKEFGKLVKAVSSRKSLVRRAMQ
ncbi:MULTISPECIES: ribosome small subunit-dependent GTPase A [Vibrio]|uniref:ribosome small subunit-dependent GTPase A n=1 Tax=Vibrio TaxID=662 RepID=UPI000B35FA10|nr:MULTISPECIES: ribosome small subunit-dependent GTPase A [Vibrio]MCK8070947.1 ribosome small subunit-dependent GTPase A [Vibrio sp. 1CM23M]PMP48128.1 ribosome small subunit-dependent GTPase A [Vibrio splendidus]